MRKIMAFFMICILTILASCSNKNDVNNQNPDIDNILPEIESAIPNDDDVEISPDDTIVERS